MSFSIMSGETFENPTAFIVGCKEFVYRKMKECEKMVTILTQHPDCPESQRVPTGPSPALSDEDIQKTIDDLNALYDESSEDAPLLPRESPEKSSRHLRPDKSSRKSKSPSPSRISKKLREYFAGQYAKRRKQATSQKNSATPQKKSAPSTRTQKVITEILVQIEKIQEDLSYLSGMITVCEDAIKCPDNEKKIPPMKLMDSIKNMIFLDYRSYVDRPIQEDEEVRDFVELKTDKNIEEHGSPEKTTAEQSPSKKHKDQASPKASKHSNEAGPSTGGGSSGTPKRTRTKSESPQEKRKKLSSKTEDESGSPDQAAGGKDTENADRSSSSAESDPESKDTVSSRLDESVKELDLSETDDSKDKMEES